MLQQPAPARRRREREEQLADGAAMQRHARAAGELQAQWPELGLDPVEIHHFAVDQRPDIAGLIDLVHEALQHDVRLRIAHRSGERTKRQGGKPRSDQQPLAARLARKIALADEPIDQPVGGRLRQFQRVDNVEHADRSGRLRHMFEDGQRARDGAESFALAEGARTPREGAGGVARRASGRLVASYARSDIGGHPLSFTPQ